MDIGCYPIVLSRFLFGAEPARVIASVERDPEFGTDRLTSALLDFRTRPVRVHLQHAARALPAHADPRHHAAASRWRSPSTRPPTGRAGSSSTTAATRLGPGIETRTFEVCDQYTLQADEVSRAIREGRPAPEPLEDAVANMEVIDALFRSAASGAWERPGGPS